MTDITLKEHLKKASKLSWEGKVKKWGLEKAKERASRQAKKAWKKRRERQVLSK